MRRNEVSPVGTSGCSQGRKPLEVIRREIAMSPGRGDRTKRGIGLTTTVAPAAFPIAHFLNEPTSIASGPTSSPLAKKPPLLPGGRVRIVN